MLYADDILIFCTGLKSNIRELISIFKKYSEVSGQVINNAKSRFYTSSMSVSRKHMIANMLGFCNIPLVSIGIISVEGAPESSLR